MDSGRFGKNMAADVSAKKNMPKRLRLKTFAEHIRGTFYALHHYYINGLIVFLQFQNSTNWYYLGFVFGFLQTG